MLACKSCDRQPRGASRCVPQGIVLMAKPCKKGRRYSPVRGSKQVLLKFDCCLLYIKKRACGSWQRIPPPSELSLGKKFKCKWQQSLSSTSANGCSAQQVVIIIGCEHLSLFGHCLVRSNLHPPELTPSAIVDQHSHYFLSALNQSVRQYIFVTQLSKDSQIYLQVDMRL